MNIAELQKQHADVMKIAAELSVAVRDERDPQPVASLRWRLARVLLAHLAVEDGHFYPAMLAEGNQAARDTAARFQSEMGTLSAAFTAYISAWTDFQIAADWPKFCMETRAVLAALERRVAQEDSQLYPLAPASWDIPKAQEYPRNAA